MAAEKADWLASNTRASARLREGRMICRISTNGIVGLGSSMTGRILCVFRRVKWRLLDREAGELVGLAAETAIVHSITFQHARHVRQIDRKRSSILDGNYRTKVFNGSALPKRGPLQSTVRLPPRSLPISQSSTSKTT